LKVNNIHYFLRKDTKIISKIKDFAQKSHVGYTKPQQGFGLSEHGGTVRADILHGFRLAINQIFVSTFAKYELLFVPLRAK